jgi:hypothetical protein
LWEWACVLPSVYLLGAGLLQKTFLLFAIMPNRACNQKTATHSGPEITPYPVDRGAYLRQEDILIIASARPVK